MMICRQRRGDSPGIGQGVAVKGAGGINPDPRDSRMAGQSGDLSLRYFAHGPTTASNGPVVARRR